MALRFGVDNVDVGSKAKLTLKLIILHIIEISKGIIINLF